MTKKCECGNIISEDCDECDACKRSFWRNFKTIGLTIGGAVIGILTVVNKFRK